MRLGANEPYNNPKLLHTSNQHENPFDRVVIAGDSANNFGLNYDREKDKDGCI